MKMKELFFALVIVISLCFSFNSMAEDDAAVANTEPTEAGLNGGTNACPNCMIQDSIANKSPREVQTVIGDILKKDSSGGSGKSKGVK